jgi:hypothetical protein
MESVKRYFSSLGYMQSATLIGFLTGFVIGSAKIDNANVWKGILFGLVCAVIAALIVWFLDYFLPYSADISISLITVFNILLLIFFCYVVVAPNLFRY